jgi:type II secretory ATPase GspE/PulE/Tfp pilus assembly ATPase PilB-like protein
MLTSFLSDATPVFLLSPWKPVLIFAVFIAWGWLMSTHIEKDAKAAHLDVAKWNGIMTAGAFVGLGVMLFGINFYVAFPIGILVLLAPIIAYWKTRNAAVAPEHQFKIGTDTLKASREKKKIAKANKQVTLKFEGANGTVKVPEKEDANIAVYLAVEEIISDALKHRASRIDIRLTKNGCQSMYLVDGIQKKQEPISSELGAKVFTFMKEMAGADPTDARRLQSGKFDISGASGSSHVDLTASGSSSAHALRLEFDRTERVLRTWESIGLLPKQRDLLDQLKRPELRHGIVLFGGESQSGLTTTSYAILSQHDSYLNNIVTLEKQVLATLEGITHNKADDDNYATQLQTAIRRDPDVLLAADLSESEAAKIVAKPGKEGPLIFVSMRASSLSDLLSKWAGLVSNPRLSFDGLQAVVYQKLVRKLCENCRVAYKPSPDLAKQGLPIDSVEQLFRKGGTIEHKNKSNPCPICEGSGYIGQIGVFETMFLDNETRKYLIAGDLKGALANARRSKRLIRLQDAGWNIVASGQTSLEEFGRVNKKKSTKKTTKAST